jgi:glycine cleavage system transcriptional repressor
MHNYIVTVTAADRVGIVHALTGALRDEGGNILELSQTVMRGIFTIILEVEFPNPRDPARLVNLIKSRGERFDLTTTVIAAGDLHPGIPSPQGERFILTVLGDDSPGNIHGIAACLAGHGVNIVDLHARVDGSRFSMVMEAFLPPDIAPGALREELERFGREHGLEAYVQHENIFLATTEPSPVRVAAHPRPQGAAVVPH